MPRRRTAARGPDARPAATPRHAIAGAVTAHPARRWASPRPRSSVDVAARRARRHRARTRWPSCWHPTPGSRRGRWRASPRAASCRGCRWPSSRCWRAADTTPTLVFDEVDAGIGGRSADPVGRSLWRLARHHQVLCVTHLPQIAAHADAHLQIAKSVRDGRTVTAITELTGEERVARDRGDARRRQRVRGHARARPGSCWSAPRALTPAGRQRDDRPRSGSPGRRRRTSDARRPGRRASRPTSTTCGSSVASPRPPSAPMTPTCARSPQPRPDIERWADSADARAAATSPRWAGRPGRCGRPASGARPPRSGPSTASAPRRSSSRATSRTSWTCPAASLALPETLDVAEVEALLEATGPGHPAGHPRPGAAGAAVRVRAARQRGARARPARTCRSTTESVRVIGKGDRERVVPVGDVALGGPRPLPRRGPPGLAARPTRRRGRGPGAPRGAPRAARCSCRRAASAGPDGGLAGRPALSGAGRICAAM